MDSVLNYIKYCLLYHFLKILMLALEKAHKENNIADKHL